MSALNLKIITCLHSEYIISNLLNSINYKRMRENVEINGLLILCLKSVNCSLKPQNIFLKTLLK